MDELKNIIDRLEKIERKTQAYDEILSRISACFSPQGVEGADVDDSLSGRYDDPVILKDPPGWKGETCAGKKYSECPAKYLEDLAGFLDWAAKDDKKKNNLTSAGKPRYVYRMKDAERARKWAKRKSLVADNEEKLVDDAPPVAPVDSSKYSFDETKLFSE